jgi:hypothetical protein
MELFYRKVMFLTLENPERLAEFLSKGNSIFIGNNVQYALASNTNFVLPGDIHVSTIQLHKVILKKGHVCPT